MQLESSHQSNKNFLSPI